MEKSQFSENLFQDRRAFSTYSGASIFANKLAIAVGRMAFGTAATNFLAVMFGGVMIAFRQFYSVDFLKLVLYLAIATFHVFVYAWPSDCLTESSKQVAESILHGQWVGRSPRMHSSISIMMRRANDPVIIKVDGLLPILNLETFGSGLSTSFSYIATLLAIFDE